MLNFFESFGVILECFWSKTLQRTLQILYCIAFVLTVLELKTKALGNCTEIASKQQTLKLSTISESIWGNFHYKLDSSLNEGSLKRGVLPLLRVFNILVHEVYR